MATVEQALTMQPTPDQGIVLTPLVTPQQALRRLQEFQGFVAQVMQEGTDYGRIPGTDKPTLLKPGAEKLCELYGLAPVVEVTHRIEDWENGRFAYEVRCRLVHKATGTVVAEGVGSCNSLESRYRYRWVWPEQLPQGIDRATLVTRKTKNGKVQYRIENDDPYSLVNTILKMAKKRALIDAVLSATRSSGLFTQDVEDLAEPVVDDAADTPAPAATSARTNGAPKPATDAQIKKIFALRKKLADIGWSEDEVVTIWRARFGERRPKELTAAEASQAIELLEQMEQGRVPAIDAPEGAQAPAPGPDEPFDEEVPF